FIRETPSVPRAYPRIASHAHRRRKARVRPGAPVAARRVARALLDCAEKKDAHGRVQAGLREVVSALQAHPELRSALGHPALSPERRKKLAATVFASAHTLVREFCELSE